MGNVIAPVIAVGEMEGVDVPLIRRIAFVDDSFAQFVGRADLGAAAFAGVVEGVLVHFLGGRVVDDVDCLDTLVVSLDPGIDPESLDADDLLLLIGHRAGDVHHVDNDGDTLGLLDFFPAAILLVLTNRHDQGRLGIVAARSDLAAQGPFEGAFEVTQRLGTSLANAGVAIAGTDDVLFASRLDARQGQLFPEDLGHFLHGQLDLEDVSAGLVAGSACAIALGWSQGRTGLPLPLTGTAGSLGTVAELRDLDLRQGNAHQVSALFADHFAAADVLRQVAFHLAAHNLPKALMIAFDFLAHGQLRV